MTDPSVFKGKTITSIGLNKKTLARLPKYGKGQVGIDGNLLGSIKVYEDNNLPDDKIIVGYKGKEFFDAGFVYTPHSGVGMSTTQNFIEVLLDAGITTLGECDE